MTASIRVVPLTRLLAGRTSLIRPYSGEVLSCSGRPFHQVLVLQSNAGVAKIYYFLGLMVIGITFHFSTRVVLSPLLRKPLELLFLGG